MHLFGNSKDVFFIVFNKLLFFYISLSCVDSMLCFLFCIQIFIFAPTRLPQLPQSSLLRYILTDRFIPPPPFFSPYVFVHPQVFSVAESKPCFNLDQISSTCLPAVPFISLVKVSQNLSWRSACWSFHTCCFGTNCLHRCSLFIILASQTSSLC